MPSWSSGPSDDTRRRRGLTGDAEGLGSDRRRRSPGRRLPALASGGAVVGLLAYLLAVYATVPRLGPGGGGDRAPGIVLARYRQAQLEVADDRLLPGPSLAALPSASMPATLAPGLAGLLHGSDGSDFASRPAMPGGSRSPPVV